jgi:choline dehydrogenase-like flavoprotein
MGATEFTKTNPTSAAVFDLDGKPTQYFGSGHVVGTYCMGDDPDSSVVDSYQRSHDHPNLFLVGDGVFRTITTANPTLTIAALSSWAGRTLVNDFDDPSQPGSKPVTGG